MGGELKILGPRTGGATRLVAHFRSLGLRPIENFGVYGGFHLVRIPQIGCFQKGKSIYKWMMTRGTTICGTPPIITYRLIQLHTSQIFTFHWGGEFLAKDWAPYAQWARPFTTADAELGRRARLRGPFGDPLVQSAIRGNEFQLCMSLTEPREIWMQTGGV